MNARRNILGRLARIAAAAALVAAAPAWAWTNKPVRMIVPAPAGGTMDIVARVLAEQLATQIGQPVVVDNKPGAGGIIGIQSLLQSPPDGQTIMVTASNVLTEIPHVLKGNFDPLKDVKPIAAVARASMVLVASSSVPAKDVKELVAYLKTKAGTQSFASYSAGTSSHYAGMILNQKAGLDLQHVPFPGSPPALVQVVAGQIPVMFDGMATSLPQIQGGKVKVIGVASKARSALLPNVPTLAEQGYGELDFGNWVGVVAAGAVPPELAERMHAEVLKAAAMPKVRERLQGAGFETGITTSVQELAASVRAEHERNGAIVKQFNIRLAQ
ncbi:Bug family tripartite tricarboxylate transporter substrate binding protein [Ramlibacter sp.]|uniref:Bug family tripartite tricarboxylate transporter substrate binding protein n=1 Tax=Ramlibacter sp. TaxID=1917967 RepID=UPI0035B4734F